MQFWQTKYFFRLGQKITRTSVFFTMDRENMAYISCFLEIKNGKWSIFDKKSKIFAWAPKNRKNAILQWELTRENLAYIFLFLEKSKKENEALLTKKRTFSLGPKTFEKVLFYNGDSTRKSGMHFLVFGEKEQKMKQFWIKIQKTLGPKTLDKVLFYNGN